jgi:hypothetical protein
MAKLSTKGVTLRGVTNGQRRVTRVKRSRGTRSMHRRELAQSNAKTKDNADEKCTPCCITFKG